MPDATDLSFTTPRPIGVGWRAPLPLLLMATSGFAGLGYQIVWTRQGALWLGHEAAAVFAVVAAFFGGLAVGALVLGATIERSLHPVRWYVACELVVAGWGLVLLGAMSSVDDLLLGLIGVRADPGWQWTVAFVGMFVLLLPATAAMGATLPAIERVVSRSGHGERSLAALYASNTAGAVGGVLATAFWLIPSLGLSATALVCIALNVSCAACASLLATGRAVVDVAPARPIVAPTDRSRVQWTLAATGLLGIGYEVLVVRVLGQVCEDTVYTFAMLLAVYLSGTALGAAAYARASATGRAEGVDDVTDRLLGALAIACLVGTSTLWFAEASKTALLASSNGGVAAALLVEAALAIAAFGLPTVAMGALFSHLAARAQATGVPFGRALGANIVGAAAAPLVFGVLMASTFGAKVALLAVVAGYLALPSWKRPGRTLAVVGVVAATGLAIGAPPLAFVDVPDGGRVVSYRDGAMASVSVVEDAEGVARLRIDNRQQEGSSASLFVDARQALLPVLLHPAPRRALFLGLGTGVTAASAAEDRQLEVDAVELLPDVIEASRHFTRDVGDGQAKRLHPIAADARRYIRTVTADYDVIVADNFHPARGGSGALYTVEHFRGIHARLATGGLFCQWLPLHQLDLDTLRSLVRSFVTVYPGGWAVLASNSLGTPVVGLVSRDGRRFDVAAVRSRLSSVDLPRRPAAFGFDDEYALLGSFVAGPEALARFAGDAPLNTDDHPVVAYRAPWVTYAPRSTPADRLIELLAALSVEPTEVLDDADPAFAARLAAYWSARRRFIEVGRDVRPSADVRVMLARVAEPLLAVLETSPDFRPAYDPLLRMAEGLGRVDPAGAERLLGRLVEMQPMRPEAAIALLRLRSEPIAR